VKIGILGMQGDIEEHEATLRSMHVTPLRVKTLEHLSQVQGLIIPGGESTTMIRLLNLNGLTQHLVNWIVQNDIPVFGTCAGMILMSKKIVNYPHQPTLGLMDIEVERNAFGRQVDSFEIFLDVKGIEGPQVPARFIRAPVITSLAPDVQVLSEYEGQVVMARQGNLLACSFHPELLNETRIHRFFVRELVEPRLRDPGLVQTIPRE